MIAEALRRHAGNKTRVADELGVSRRNLIRLCQRYELDEARRPGGRVSARRAAKRPRRSP